jgi:diguanylate cyclase (GGDEF)-like protein
MDTAVIQAMLSDLLLSLVLFVLFQHVARVSGQLVGIASWGTAQLAYTVGVNLLDTLPAMLGNDVLVRRAMLHDIGAVVACAGMAGLARATVHFVHQRPLYPAERIAFALAVALPLAAWALAGDALLDGIPLTLVEVAALLTMGWHLHALRGPGDRLPRWLMSLGCLALAVLYASVIPGWFGGRHGLDDQWVSTDLALWFLLNFCMLVLTSFHAAEALRTSARTDPLTGAFNRRGLEQLATWSGPPCNVAVALLDLDHFKAINDGHGHGMGDRVLARFADTVRTCIRADDRFARLGGDEFLLVMPGVDAAQAGVLVERIRQACVAGMVLAEAPELRVRLSAGIATGLSSDRLDDLIHAADAALYEAKRRGRDQVRVHVPERPAA